MNNYTIILMDYRQYHNFVLFSIIANNLSLFQTIVPLPIQLQENCQFIPNEFTLIENSCRQACF